jgi:hypothetical protein
MKTQVTNQHLDAASVQPPATLQAPSTRSCFEENKGVRTLILSVVAAALLSVLPYASAQQSGENGIPTNLPGVTSAPAPPSGFSPLTASDGELATYGFPPRPDRKASPGAYAAWAKAMQAAKERVFPVLELTNHFNGPHVAAGPIRENTGYSYNWSAVVDTTTAHSYGPTSFTSVEGYWVIPIAQQAFGACTGGWDYESSWVGIDGYGSNDVLQAGTESDAYCNAGTKSTYYAAWYEWYPLGEVRISSLPVLAGDTMVIYVASNSSTSGTAFVENWTTGQYASINFSAPAGTQLVGNSAEWVVERPGINGGLATLTNYISEVFVNGWANTAAGTQYGPGSIGTTWLTMLDNSGNPISRPLNTLGLNGVWFADEGSAY